MSLETTVQEYIAKTEELLAAVNLRKADLDAAVTSSSGSSAAAQTARQEAEAAGSTAEAAKTSAQEAQSQRPSSRTSRLIRQLPRNRSCGARSISRRCVLLTA